MSSKFLLDRKRAQIEQNRIHRIRLKKGLAKAKKSLDDQQIPIPTYENTPVEEETDTDRLNENKMRKNKSNPFMKEMALAAKRNAERQALLEARRLEREEKEANLRANAKARTEQSRLMAQRTRKGQPIMAHRINNLLEKIKQSQ